jgi:hypothetical protein
MYHFQYTSDIPRAVAVICTLITTGSPNAGRRITMGTVLVILIVKEFLSCMVDEFYDYDEKELDKLITK